MFYPEFVLCGSGPLSRPWLVANWPSKVSNREMVESNVEAYCKDIREPQTKLALRLSSHLLFGVCYIHNKKQSALMHDCTQAFNNFKQAFRPSAVDSAATHANPSAITLVEPDADRLTSLWEVDDELEGYNAETWTSEFELQPVEAGRAESRASLGGNEDDWVQAEDLHVVAPSQGVPHLEVEVGRRDESDAGPDNLTESRDDELAGHRMPVYELEPEVEDFDERTAPDQSVFGPSANGTFDDSMGDVLGEIQVDLRPLGEMDDDEIQPAQLSNKKAKRMIIDQSVNMDRKAFNAYASKAHGPDEFTREPYTPEFYKNPISFDHVPLRTSAIKRTTPLDESPNDLMLPASLGLARNPVIAQLFPKRLRLANRAAPSMPADDSGATGVDYSGFRMPEYEMEPEVEDMDLREQPTLDPSMDMETSLGREATVEETHEDPQAPDIERLEEETLAEPETVTGEATLRQLVLGFEKKDELSYFGLTRKQTRLGAALALRDLLVLKTNDSIEVEQEEPYADIYVTATDCFEAATAGLAL